MAEQAQQKAQSDSSGNAAEIAAVAAVLAAGPPLITAVGAISAALKTPKKLALAALAAIKYKPGKKGAGKGLLAAVKAQNQKFRAAYLINAIRRLADAPDLQSGLKREKALFAAHLKASQRRTDAAKKTLNMSDHTGEGTLGWGGILDDRTTPDCRWLIGKNFDASNPPGGLYPGARHVYCRCYPTPAYPGKPVVTELPAHLGGNFPV
jgi:hypothetical protein